MSERWASWSCPFMISMNLTPATRWGLNLIALLGAVIALRLGETIFIPTVIAVLLAALMWPVATWLNRGLRLPWSVACLASVGILVLLTLLIALSFALVVTKVVQDIPPNTPEGETTQQRLYTNFRDQLARISPLALDKDYFPEDP